MKIIRHADYQVMLNRVLEIYEENRYLSLERGFLVVKQGEDVLGKVPLDDIGVLLISSQSAGFSKNILNALSERGCITILCGENYSPQSLVFPLSIHCQQTKIIKNQINSSIPFKKRIWQQIVAAKIQNQALTLEHCNKAEDSRLINKIAGMVSSGDKKNLAKILLIKVHTEMGESPLFQSMHYYARSYAKSLDVKKPVIEIPDWKGNKDGITIIE